MSLIPDPILHPVHCRWAVHKVSISFTVSGAAQLDMTVHSRWEVRISGAIGVIWVNPSFEWNSFFTSRFKHLKMPQTESSQVSAPESSKQTKINESFPCLFHAAVKSHLALTFKASHRCFDARHCPLRMESPRQFWTCNIIPQQPQCSELMYNNCSNTNLIQPGSFVCHWVCRPWL